VAVAWEAVRGCAVLWERERERRGGRGYEQDCGLAGRRKSGREKEEMGGGGSAPFKMQSKVKRGGGRQQRLNVRTCDDDLH
jgi:hypothetical protein